MTQVQPNKVKIDQTELRAEALKEAISQMVSSDSKRSDNANKAKNHGKVLTTKENLKLKKAKQDINLSPKQLQAFKEAMQTFIKQVMSEGKTPEEKELVTDIRRLFSELTGVKDLSLLKDTTAVSQFIDQLITETKKSAKGTLAQVHDQTSKSDETDTSGKSLEDSSDKAKGLTKQIQDELNKFNKSYNDIQNEDSNNQPLPDYAKSGAGVPLQWQMSLASVLACNTQLKLMQLFLLLTSLAVEVYGNLMTATINVAKLYNDAAVHQGELQASEMRAQAITGLISGVGMIAMGLLSARSNEGEELERQNVTDSMKTRDDMNSLLNEKINQPEDLEGVKLNIKNTNVDQLVEKQSEAIRQKRIEIEGKVERALGEEQIKKQQRKAYLKKYPNKDKQAEYDQADRGNPEVQEDGSYNGRFRHGMETNRSAGELNQTQRDILEDKAKQLAYKELFDEKVKVPVQVPKEVEVEEQVTDNDGVKKFEIHKNINGVPILDIKGKEQFTNKPIMEKKMKVEKDKEGNTVYETKEKDVSIRELFVQEDKKIASKLAVKMYDDLPAQDRGRFLRMTRGEDFQKQLVNGSDNARVEEIIGKDIGLNLSEHKERLDRHIRSVDQARNTITQIYAPALRDVVTNSGSVAASCYKRPEGVEEGNKTVAQNNMQMYISGMGQEDKARGDAEQIKQAFDQLLAATAQAEAAAGGARA